MFTHPQCIVAIFSLLFVDFFDTAGTLVAVASKADLIDENGLANIRELRRFVKTRGAEHNLPSMKIINSVLRSHTGLIRLYFDAVYQERWYGRSDIDKDTDEVLNNK